jgi:regulator of replication initiation timing
VTDEERHDRQEEASDVAQKGALMEVFAKLEERIEKLIVAHKELRDHLAELEEENRKLRQASEESVELQDRVEELEAEREEVRGRLEKVLESLASLEL